MDPNTTLAAFLDELCDPKGSPRQLQIMADALIGWTAKGGFRPSDPRKIAAALVQVHAPRAEYAEQVAAALKEARIRKTSVRVSLVKVPVVSL